MKKIKLHNIIIFTLSVLFLPYHVNAQKNTVITADPFPAERTGQYIYYHDMRRNIYGSKDPVDRLIGILKADNKQYIIHVRNLKNNKSFLYLGHYFLNDGIIEFKTDSIQGDAKEGILILGDLVNLMSYMGNETARHGAALKMKTGLKTISLWESYKRKFENSYEWWIPFYKLERSCNAENDNHGKKGDISLKLICFGSVSQSDPDMFTRINKLPVYLRNKISEKKYLIPEAEKMTVRLDNTSLDLDKNWHFEKGDISSGLPDSYWIKKFTSRDAQIAIETIASSGIKSEKNIIDSFVNSLQYQSCVIADTVEIDSAGKSLSLILWDTDSRTATFTKYINLGIKKNNLTMFNFSAFDFIYYSNTEYFNRILKR